MSEVKTFNSITSLDGCIVNTWWGERSQIYFTVNSHQKCHYVIHMSKSQYGEMKKVSDLSTDTYKLKVEQIRSIATGEILHANLLSFKKKEDTSFQDVMQELSKFIDYEWVKEYLKDKGISD